MSSDPKVPPFPTGANEAAEADGEIVPAAKAELAPIRRHRFGVGENAIVAPKPRRVSGIVDVVAVPVLPDKLPTDRRLELLVFGVFLVLLGFIVGLKGIPGAVVDSIVAIREGRPLEAGYLSRMFGSGVLVACLLALGLGSIFVRVWARKLALAAGWLWLCVGSLLTGYFAFFLPQKSAGTSAELMTAQPSLSGARADEIANIAMLTSGALHVIVGLVLPAFIVAFYRSRNVEATCRYVHRRARWTVESPVPVLVVAVACFVAFVGFASVIVGNHQPEMIPALAFGAAAFLLAAWWNSCARKAGWWMALTLSTAIAFVSVSVFLDLSDTFMGNFPIPGGGAGLLPKVASLNPRGAAWSVLVVFAFALIYLGCIRRFYGRTSTELRA